MMYPRLELLRELLSENGTIWITLDDNEIHYFKCICDEIFGRENFVNQVSVKMKLVAGASGGGEDKKLKKNIEFALCYAKNYNSINGFKKFNDLYDEESLFSHIDSMESDGKSWKYTSVIIAKGEFIEERTIVDGAGEPIKIKKYKGLQRTTINNCIKDGMTREQAYINNFEGVFSDTNAQTSIRTRVIDEFQSLEKDELLEVSYVPRSGKDKGEKVEHLYLSPTIRRVIWLKDTAEKRGDFLFKKEKVGTYWGGFSLNNLTKEGQVQFANGKKPEALVERALLLATDEKDLVLDSFLGSATTSAVAQKMNRRYIGIEIGEHAQTHCQPRLQKVIDGEQGGISKAINWQGGGGFRFCKLGSTVFDEYGCLNPEIRFPALAAHIWYLENKQPFSQDQMQALDSPLLGEHDGRVYYLLYNGILGDRRPQGGNVLTSKVLGSLPDIETYIEKSKQGEVSIVIYGESTRLGEARLQQAGVEFKQIPYDVGSL